MASKLLTSKMQYHAPHDNVAFEGYYNKFDLDSGSHVVLVISQVSQSNSNGNALTFTYVPKDGTQIYQKIIFVDDMTFRRIDSRGHAFTLEIPGIGSAKWNDDASAEYKIETDNFTFHAISKPGMAWPTGNQTPEGLLANMPLPLHWHVQSLASACELSMTISDYNLPMNDASSKATVHQEKNWAHSFPSAHIWLQARKSDRAFCCAGGEILGMKAFLVGYRSDDFNLAFTPPFALSLPGFGPFMSYTVDWESRTFSLRVQSFRKKITVQASAPKGSFFSLAAPFPEGHRPNFLGQSLNAKIEVKIYESGWFGAWQLVREDFFEDGSLEFGAAYYPPAGSEECFH